MSSLPPGLVDPIEQLRAKLVEINTSEQTCMIDIDTFRHECSVISAQANSLTKAAIVAATATSVSDFWIKSESYATAFAAEAAALLPAHGPDKTSQAITNTCTDRTTSINRYIEQLTT